LAEPEDVLILAHTFLKFGGKSQPQRSYKNGSYKEKRVYQNILFCFWGGGLGGEGEVLQKGIFHFNLINSV